jgi:hypothetical protein
MDAPNLIEAVCWLHVAKPRCFPHLPTLGITALSHHRRKVPTRAGHESTTLLNLSAEALSEIFGLNVQTIDIAVLGRTR